jgi:hypothetical protein
MLRLVHEVLLLTANDQGQTRGDRLTVIPYFLWEFTRADT